MDINQTKVFCLFQTQSDLKSFYVSDLARSDILRCLITLKDEKKQKPGFYESLEGNYLVKYLELSSIERKSRNVDFLERRIPEFLSIPHTLETQVHFFIDFSFINLSPNKINTIVEAFEKHLATQTYKPVKNHSWCGRKKERIIH